MFTYRFAPRSTVLGLRGYKSILKKPKIGPPSPLVQWQEDALSACTTALQTGATKIALQTPSGDAKISTLVSLIERIPPPRQNQGATRSIILSVSLKRIEAIALDVMKRFPDLTVELDWKAKKKASGTADVWVVVLSEHVISRDNSIVVKAQLQPIDISGRLLH